MDRATLDRISLQQRPPSGRQQARRGGDDLPWAGCWDCWTPSAGTSEIMPRWAARSADAGFNPRQGSRAPEATSALRQTDWTCQARRRLEGLLANAISAAQPVIDLPFSPGQHHPCHRTVISPPRQEHARHHTWQAGACRNGTSPWKCWVTITTPTSYSGMAAAALLEVLTCATRRSPAGPPTAKECCGRPTQAINRDDCWCAGALRGRTGTRAWWCTPRRHH